ncbi:excisionase family DNA-binding protein [Microbacterium aurum]|uniref:excisionase family DNA-binding protein n=1 Tax=Microbacterium aurum TaxID=36805 RepID=UPI0028F0375D|nr:excisionase family DNA-binding protein [Microbacterium aurum]
MLTSHELADAEHLNCDLTTVYRMAQRGQIPYIRVGGPRGESRFDWDAVKDALRPAEKVDPWINPRARRR